MKISTIIYTVKQGFINLFRNKWYTLASIATISACLFMFGIFYALITNVQHMVKGAQDVVMITVFFDEGISQERVDEIGEQIEKRPEVSEIRFISAEDAWKFVQKEYFGDKAEEFLESYPENPMSNSFNYEVYLKNVEDHQELVTYISSIPGVRQINNEAEVAEILGGVNLLLSYVSIAIIAVLLAVSVFLIGNTVAVGISVRSEEINIMKYIGATDFIVRAPFVIEGVLIGLLGTIIPLVVIHEVYNVVLTYMVEHFAMLNNLLDFLPVETLFDFLVPLSLCVGAGIGFAGSIITVRKHLNV